MADLVTESIRRIADICAWERQLGNSGYAWRVRQDQALRSTALIPREKYATAAQWLGEGEG